MVIGAFTAKRVKYFFDKYIHEGNQSIGHYAYRILLRFGLI